MNVFPPRTILVALDSSPASYAAWLHAKGLHKRFKCQVQAVYVRPAEFAANALTDIPSSVIAAAQRKTINVLKTWTEGITDLKVKRGEAASVILRLASKGGYDLIILGTHGRSGAKRLIFGSVANAVVRGSGIPVLVVRRKPQKVRSILAPVNFTDYSKAGFELALRAAQAYKAQLVGLHVARDWENIDEIDDQFNDLMRMAPEGVRKYGKVARSMEIGSSPVHEILEQSRDYQMMILTAHRKKLLQDWILGSTTERLLRYADIPVLIMPWAPVSRTIEIKAKERRVATA